MLETYTGPVLPSALLDDLTGVYGEVFGDPPWHEDTAAAQAFRQRLTTDAGRDGFRAVVARTGTRIDGFATGWLTRTPLPDERAYPRVTSQLGEIRTCERLDGAFEVDELAVVPTARGRGLGRRLLHLITQTAPQRRAWLLTARHASVAVVFYRRMGWHEADPLPHAGNDIVVFLAPQHPQAGG
jgi:GNAT superfamily N-acetyltransferase